MCCFHLSSFFFPQKEVSRGKSFFILAHFQPPTDRVIASRQSLILLDISPPSSKWTQFILGLIVCISTVMHALGESLEHNKKSRCYPVVICIHRVVLIHGFLCHRCCNRLHLLLPSHCQPWYNRRGHSITEPVEFNDLRS